MRREISCGQPSTTLLDIAADRLGQCPLIEDPRAFFGDGRQTGGQSRIGEPLPGGWGATVWEEGGGGGRIGRQ